MPRGRSASRSGCRRSRARRTRSRSARRLLTRRSSGGRVASALPSATQVSPKASASSGAAHSGISARMWSGAPASGSGAVRRASSASVGASGACGIGGEGGGEAGGVLGPIADENREREGAGGVFAHGDERARRGNGARHRRDCRWRRGHRRRQSGWRGPRPSAPRRPGGGGDRYRPGCRWRRRLVREVAWEGLRVGWRGPSRHGRERQRLGAFASWFDRLTMRVQDERT